MVVGTGPRGRVELEDEDCVIAGASGWHGPKGTARVAKEPARLAIERAEEPAPRGGARLGSKDLAGRRAPRRALEQPAHLAVGVLDVLLAEQMHGAPHRPRPTAREMDGRGGAVPAESLDHRARPAVGVEEARGAAESVEGEDVRADARQGLASGDCR